MENFYDKVIKRLSERNKLVKAKLKKQFANQTPFRMKPLSDKEFLNIYDNMAEQDWYDALDKYGAEQVTAFKDKAEQMRRL